MFRAIIKLLSHKYRVVIHLDAGNHPVGTILYGNTDDVTTEIKGHTIFETGSSVVSKLDNGSILKCLKIRNWSEYHKLFLGKHRAKEEVMSNFEMQRIGLTVPSILYYGIFSNIFSKREFSSFYAMEEVPASFIPGNLIFEALSAEARQYFLARTIQDLHKLKDHQLVYSDLSLRNFHINESGESIWIDTQIKKYTSVPRFKKKFHHSLKRFFDEPSLDLTIEEEKKFKELLV
jgi:hypothetical protein